MKKKIRTKVKELKITNLPENRNDVITLNLPVKSTFLIYVGIPAVYAFYFLLPFATFACRSLFLFLFISMVRGWLDAFRSVRLHVSMSNVHAKISRFQFSFGVHVLALVGKHNDDYVPGEERVLKIEIRLLLRNAHTEGWACRKVNHGFEFFSLDTR